MARIDDTAQWIVMLGFIISIMLVLIALIVNQSALVGKTTSESVLEFPKSEIQDLRSEIMEYYWTGDLQNENLFKDLQNISLHRKGSVVNASYNDSEEFIFIHYNDGLTEYNEITWGGG